MHRTWPPARTDVARLAAVLIAALLAAPACRFDPAYRDVPAPPGCTAGQKRCYANALQACVGNASAASWQSTQDCSATGLTCAPSIPACTKCVPGQVQCQGLQVTTCDASGAAVVVTQTCDPTRGYACRDGACS
jgi:hypothetical protein